MERQVAAVQGQADQVLTHRQ